MGKRILVIVLAVAVSGMTGCAELERLRKENTSLSNQLQVCKEERDGLLSNIRTVEANRDDLQAKLNDARDESRRMAELADRMKQEQSRLEQQRQELQRLVQDLSGITIERRGEGNFIVVENDILFALGSIELTDEAKTSLDKVAQYLRDRPGVTIRIDGHTDGVPVRLSGWKDNYHLSAMRAHAVMQYLVQQGVDAARCSIEGFGPNRPRVQPEDPAEPMAVNRRVEILVVPEGARSVSEILQGFEQ